VQLGVASADGTSIAVEESGHGSPVVLLHGLTATRRYVTMGSSVLQRSGHRMVAYDARGHGRSEPAPRRDGYTYGNLHHDLLAVLDALGISRAVIAGASMGAHTAVRMALADPDRVAALGLITPAYDPDAPADPGACSRGQRLAEGLREEGVEGFVGAYDFSSLPDAWRGTVERAMRQRLSEHADLRAVADALEVVPRSRPFERIEELRRLAVPTLVIASRDEADPEHPLAIGERYAAAIPGARLIVEDTPPPLRSPIAWQGGRVSQLLSELASGAA
jgi:pimeloyl-ACP methyl ester carboxylesterase